MCIVRITLFRLGLLYWVFCALHSLWWWLLGWPVTCDSLTGQFILLFHFYCLVSDIIILFGHHYLSSTGIGVDDMFVIVSSWQTSKPPKVLSTSKYSYIARYSAKCLGAVVSGSC